MAAAAPPAAAPMPPVTKIKGKCLDNIAKWDESQNMTIGYSADITELPEFPLTLRKLNIEGQYMVTTLPEFPPTLEELTLHDIGTGTQIASVTIPALPDSLRKLTLKSRGNAKPFVLPALPASLRELVLEGCRLTAPLTPNEGLLKLHVENSQSGGPVPGIFSIKTLQIASLPASLTHLKMVQQNIDSVLPLLAGLPALRSLSFHKSQASATPVLPDSVATLALSEFTVTNPEDPRMFAMPASLRMLNMAGGPGLGGVAEPSISGISRLSPVLQQFFASYSQLASIQGDQFPDTLEQLYLEGTPITQLPNIPAATTTIALLNCTELPPEIQQLVAQNSGQWDPGLIRRGWGPDANTPLERFKNGLRAYNARRLGRDLGAMAAVFGAPPPPPPPGAPPAPFPPQLYDPFGNIAAAQAAAEAAKPAGQRFKEGAPENVMSRIASFLTGAPGSRTTQRAVLQEMASRGAGAGAGMGGGRRKTRKNKNKKN